MITEGKALPFRTRAEAKGYIDWIAPAVLSYPDKYDFTVVSATNFILEEAKRQVANKLSKEELLKKIKAFEKQAEEYKCHGELEKYKGTTDMLQRLKRAFDFFCGDDESENK